MFECDCENCKHYEEHPFARETMDDWCNKHETFIENIDDCFEYLNE